MYSIFYKLKITSNPPIDQFWLDHTGISLHWLDVFVQFVQFVQFVKIYLIGATPYIFFRTFLLQLDNEILGKALLKLKLQKLCLCYVTNTVTFPFGEERLKLPFIFLHWLDVFVLPISCRQHGRLSIYLYCICTVQNLRWVGLSNIFFRTFVLQLDN